MLHKYYNLEPKRNCIQCETNFQTAHLLKKKNVTSEVENTIILYNYKNK